MKLLVVVLALVLLGWLLFGRSRKRPPPPEAGAGRSAAQSEGMVACAHCGVHLPASEAVRAQGRSYCSASHRDASAAP